MSTLIRVVAFAIVPMLFAAPAPALANYERAELEQMLAPIALYPDSVLSHVLIAATYPDQVGEAARWSRAHPKLEGEAAVDAVENYDWDASVKALVAFPEVLARMDEDPEWTDQLGDAFLDNEGEVMDAVQHLRTRAYEAGRLESLDNVRVVREREYIYIEPAVHSVLFVPYYDPWWVYGSWWWPHYPPYCWRTWHGRPASYYGGGWYWGVGFHVRPAFYFTTFYWPERHVVVTHRHDRPLYSGRDAPRHQEVRHWRDDPSARRHAERSAGADRREDRRDERHDDGRGNRSPVTSGEPRRDEARDDPRRERMERGRQHRDAERGERSADSNVRRSPEHAERSRSEDQVRREVAREPARSSVESPRSERREGQVRREEGQDRRDEAQGRRDDSAGRSEGAREGREPRERSQGRQRGDGGERGRSQREERPRR